MLITGGAGFIGSNFIHYIARKYPEYRIINLDKLTYAGNLENLRDIEDNPNYKFIKGDIADRKIIDEIFKSRNIDAITNFAAESHVDRSIEDPGVFIRTDIYGTYVLLEAARKYNSKIFLQISTDEVYGSIEDGSFAEDDALKPSSPYSASKAGAEMIVRSFFKTFGTPIIITRTTNNFGPYQYPEKIIPLFVTNLIDNIKVPLYGDGMNVRDWIYVDDNCGALDLVLHKGRVGEIYNIGAGNEKPNIWITKEILKLLDKPESMIEPVEDRLGHDRRYSVDCTKLKRDLGWETQYDFEEALKKTVNWYAANEKWWRPLKGRSI
ncbi:MAG: dTDP-glucose 4,6-dehydratase [Actinobacteria bacterium]|nr:dTDP-glucose 4,6-dehydratase [Clostridia bacterium]TET15840.1 MAG: dTDP-glucose 4,6-dehydratase [Actinomycetota bacterium]